MESPTKQHGDDSSSNDQKEPKPTTRTRTILEPSAKHRWTRRFDAFTIFAIAGGTLLIAMSTAFLFFLWFSNEKNATWRKIVVEGWLTRVVTIISLVIRWTVAIQAAAMTSMVAAALLHALETPLPHAAAVSLAVYTNSGPLELVTRLPWGLGRWRVGFWTLVILMICTTTLLQLTSTALLSDVGSGTIIDHQNTSLSYGVDFSTGLASQYTSYLDVRKWTSPAFAEYNEAVDSSDGVSDTGLTMRAFLPIDSQSARESVTEYDGPATILDTRVACMRPQLSNVKVNVSEITITGSVSTKEKVRRLNTATGVGGTFEPFDFDCRIYFSSKANEWGINVCHVAANDDATGLISDIMPEPVKPYTNSTPGSLHLVINTTGTATDWSDAVLNRPNLTIESTTNDASEWTTLQTNFSAISMGITLCSFDTLFRDVNITPERPLGNVTEPSASWDSATSRYNTRDLRVQLGGTKDASSLESRGIFQLSKLDSWVNPYMKYFFDGSATNVMPEVDGRPPTYPMLIWSSAFMDFYFQEDGGNDVGMCDDCSSPMSGLHTNIFQDTIQATNSAPRALQGLLTDLFSMAYYDYLFQFNVTDPVGMAADRDVTRPVSFRFFKAVMAILLLHLVLLALTIALFLKYTKDSFVGSAWAAVARISGAHTDRWLAAASTATDSEVSKAMKSEGEKNVLVGLMRAEDQVRLRRKKADKPEEVRESDSQV